VHESITLITHKLWRLDGQFIRLLQLFGLPDTCLGEFPSLVPLNFHCVIDNIDNHIDRGY